MSDPKYREGQHVEVLDFDHPNQWRSAWLEAGKFYNKGNTWGYRYHWLNYAGTDKVTGIRPSEGGWIQEALVRPLSEVKP